MSSTANEWCIALVGKTMKLKDLIVGNAATTTPIKVENAQAQKVDVQKQVKKRVENEESVVIVEPKIKPKVPKVKVDTSKNLFVSTLERNLKRAELWFGDPGTGKTTLARTMFEEFKAQGLIEDYIVINAQEELTVMSLFKTTKTDEDGNWKFIHNKFFKMLTDNTQARYGVIIDEFNTMPMSVMKSLQPIVDDTEGDFTFEENTYTKNPNIYFIFTMNHNDMGISQLPVAIKDRVYPKYFEKLDDETLAQRSGVKKQVIEKMRKVRQMFEHLGDLPDFHKSVRQLKSLQGANAKQVREYIVSQLALANIEYEEAIAISPEFEDLLNEFENILKGSE